MTQITKNINKMNIETLNNWSQVIFLVMLILGIMAAIYIGLCLINQKKE